MEKTIAKIKYYLNLLVSFLKKIPVYFFALRKAVIFKFILNKFLAKKKIQEWCKNLITKNTFVILSFLYFVAISFVTYFLNDSLVSGLLKNDGVTFFTSLGAMLGGVLAIVFSVSTLLMQNAAQSTSAGFYDLLAKDKWQDRIYWIISFLAFSFFVLATLFSSDEIVFYPCFKTDIAKFSIFAIGTVLWLLYLLYTRIYERIRPHSNLVIIEKDVIHLLSSMRKDSEEVAELFLLDPKADPKLSKEMALAASFQGLQPQMNAITVRFEHLFDYHDKLLSLNERKMARTVLLSIHNLIAAYLKLRSGSSIITPSQQYFFVGRSDSEKFLTPHLEALVSKGENYIKNNDGVGITHVITIFTSLIVISGDVRYGSHRSENPILGQILGYFSQLAELTTKHDNMEGMFQVAVRCNKIVSVLVDNNLEEQLPTVFRFMDKILSQAIMQKHDVVWGEIVNAYCAILEKISLGKLNNYTPDLRILFRQLQSLLLLSIVSNVTARPDDVIAMMKLGDVSDRITAVLYNLVEVIESETDARKVESLKSTLLSIVEENRRMLRNLSEKIKTADHSVISSFANNIRDTSILLLNLSAKKEWTDRKEELLRHVSWYIYQAEFFVHHADKIASNKSFNALVDAVAKIGIASLDVNNEDIASISTKVLTGFAITMLAKESGDRFGFTEPRIMVNACYIGIYALKLGMKDLIKTLHVQVTEFEKEYHKVWFSNLPEGVVPQAPTPKQLQNELTKIRERISRAEYEDHMGILDLPEDRIAQKVTLKDVDLFTLGFWHFFVTPSPLDEEMPVTETSTTPTAPDTQTVTVSVKEKKHNQNHNKHKKDRKKKSKKRH